MFNWLKKRPVLVDPDELDKKSTAAIELVEKQEPLVDRITGFLDRREAQNGFGDDFEYTLIPKGVK